MRLQGLQLPNENGEFDVTIRNGMIVEVRPTDPECKGLYIRDTIAFPGLLNMHDHLAFNLFPTLGNRKYKHYVEWGIALHTNHKPIIEQVLAVPQKIRVAYGELKNVLCGFTTVSDHERIPDSTRIIDSLPNYQYLHALWTERKWKMKLLTSLFDRRPFMVHVNEGLGMEVDKEMAQISCWNIFNKKIIGIHGISLDEHQYCKMAGLVWCPASNLELYGSTIDTPLFGHGIPVMFGADSTISSPANIWEHIRIALRYCKAEEIYHMLTQAPKQLFPQLAQKGSIKSGYQADLVIAKRKAANFFESFSRLDTTDILMVIKDGNPILVSAELKESMPDQDHLFKGKALIKALGSIVYVDARLVEPIKNRDFPFQPSFEVECIG